MEDTRYFSQHIMNLSYLNQMPSHGQKHPGTIDTYVNGYRIVKTKNEKYVLYDIKIQNMIFDYNIERRYNDFRQFYDTLRQRYPEMILPFFPTKYYFSNFDSSKLEKRRRALEKFLKELVTVCSKEKKIDELFTFIDLRSHNMHSVLDINQSQFSSTDPGTLDYIKLIYERDKVGRNLERLRTVLLKQEVKRETADLVLKGTDRFVGLFIVAFSHESYFNGHLGKMPSQERRKSLSKDFIFEEESQQNNDQVHHACALVGAFILDLFDPSKSKNSALFRRVFKKSGGALLGGAGFKRHLCSRSNTKCKHFCYELLVLYKELSEGVNDFYMFTNQEESRKFKLWCELKERKKKRESKFEDLDRPFPKVTEVLLNNQIQEDYAFGLIDHFADSINLDLLAVDEEKNIATLSFLIDKTQTEKFLKAMINFSYSPRIVETVDHFQGESDLFYVDNKQFLSAKTIFFKKDMESKQIYYDTIKFYLLTRGERNLLIFDIQKPESVEGKLKPTIQSLKEKWGEETEFLVEENDFGFFVNFDLYEENTDKTKISLLMNYSFLDKRNDMLKENYEYFRKRLFLIREYAKDFNSSTEDN